MEVSVCPSTKKKGGGALLHRVIAKQQARREQIHSMCLHAVETQNCGGIIT